MHHGGRDARPRRLIRRGLASIAALGDGLGRFGRESGGQVAIIFAVSALTLVSAVGAGIDLSRAFVVRQQLFHAASLTCQYSVRPTVVAVAYQNGASTATYINNVNSQAAVYVAAQSPTLVQTNSSPFTYARGGASSVAMNASVPTYFMGLAGVRTMPVGATITCANGMAEVDDTQPSTLIKESFENSACTGSCWSAFAPSGKANVFSATPINAPPSNYGYTGQSGNQWTISGYCLEIDAIGVIKNSVADGNYSAELDCDNGAGSAGNSAISTRNYMTVGTYELRYNYSGRIVYNNYSPTVICGSTATDVAWANDTATAHGAVLRTNQVNAYLDQDTTGVPPTHMTLDGTQSLAGANLIDECVYSDNWVERSVKITVTTAGYYWLSFAADGANDSYGGQLDNIRLCRGSCSGSVADNFPPTWKSTLLFEDTFDSPTYTDPGGGINSAATLSQSYGTSGTSGSGWPLQTASGWAVAPYNQIDYLVKNSFQGPQSLELDGLLGSGQSTSNRYQTRFFYLDPGYYQVSYNYVSDSPINGVPTIYCVAAPSAGSLAPYTYNPSFASTNRITGANSNVAADTNIIAVMMSNSQLTSYPNISATLNAATTYTNPDGSVTSVPTAAPDALYLPTYAPTQANPVLDFCYLSSAWIPRVSYVQITKPGAYWLTFAAKGAADNTGGAIDDVRLTGMNSLYGGAPPFYVSIPAGGPSPGSTISYAGFSIVADPLTP